jgi:hypothetical protein
VHQLVTGGRGTRCGTKQGTTERIMATSEVRTLLLLVEGMVYVERLSSKLGLAVCRERCSRDQQCKIDVYAQGVTVFPTVGCFGGDGASAPGSPG